MTQARAAGNNPGASPATLPTSGDPAAVTQLTVSVVVPTYRREDLLKRCLQSLSLQDFPRGGLEIIVVDDARSESVPEVVTTAARETGIPIRLLAGPGRGPAAARNLGWRAARGDVIAFLYDDADPEYYSCLKP